MKMNDYLFFGSILLLIWGCTSSKQVVKERTPLNTYSFSQLDSLAELEERPIAVFLHADWCKYCRNMEQTTFQNENVIPLLNEQFYFISFNGEHKENISFKGHEFAYRPNGRSSGTHELALALGTIEGTLVYPTLIILNPRYEIIFEYGGFLGARQLRSILSRASKK
jgi:thioredoxin-related protein